MPSAAPARIIAICATPGSSYGLQCILVVLSLSQSLRDRAVHQHEQSPEHSARGYAIGRRTVEACEWGESQALVDSPQAASPLHVAQAHESQHVNDGLVIAPCCAP